MDKTCKFSYNFQLGKINNKKLVYSDILHKMKEEDNEQNEQNERLFQQK